MSEIPSTRESAARAPVDDTERDRRRRRRLVESWGDAVRDRRVRAAMLAVPRHAFCPPAVRDRAYEDRPLPIGAGQTISQPWVVCRMTELLRPRPADRVLEIGTGSGYQAAVLAELVAEVYTIEIVPSLARRARATLERLGLKNVHTRIGDGYAGWPEAAPFDGILVTAAVDHVPPRLIEELAPGGRLVLPLGPPDGVQYLTRLTRREAGLERERFAAVRFVPMTGLAGASPRDRDDR